MKKVTTSIILITLCSIGLAQSLNQIIDSLNSIIENPKTNDTSLIQTYNLVSEHYFQINPDTTKQICLKNVERINFLLQNSRKGYTPDDRKALITEKIRSQNNIAVIEDIHNDIQSSINYAKGLQDAILPSQTEIKSSFPNNFLLFQPKDIVSGDFYWLEIQNGITFIAIADCTGHGILGAMVSIVCSTSLSRSVKEFNLASPSEILDKTRKLIIETFSKSGQNIQDGMDISLCAIKDNSLTYSGAYNPLWIIRNKELLEFKADRQPVGFYKAQKLFTEKKIQFEENDLIYLMTDGYHDQFGGENNKKFKAKKLKQLLLDNSELSMEDQRKNLQQNFKDWKGNSEQIDDVTIMGIKL